MRKNTSGGLRAECERKNARGREPNAGAECQRARFAVARAERQPRANAEREMQGDRFGDRFGGILNERLGVPCGRRDPCEIPKEILKEIPHASRSGCQMSKTSTMRVVTQMEILKKIMNTEY